jgi:hypothetical protein
MWDLNTDPFPLGVGASAANLAVVLADQNADVLREAVTCVAERAGVAGAARVAPASVGFEVVE